jgi:hypothetical protein
MREIYKSRDFQDYSKRVILLDEKFKPELVFRDKSSDCIAESDVYHLSNGVTLLRIKYAYSGGDEFHMFAFGKPRKVSKVEKIVRETTHK